MSHMPQSPVVGSSALKEPTYWWFQVRARLLPAFFSYQLGFDLDILDVGSANSPSVDWLRKHGTYTPMDLDPRGLPPEGVVGSVTAIPYANESLDVVSAFDVIEHIGDEALALSEIHRVLRPGGQVLISVPAYEWAWSANDVHNDHYRRYTIKRLTRALERAGFQVDRTSYAFAGTFPIFAVVTLLHKWRERWMPPTSLAPDEVHPLPPVSSNQAFILKTLSRVDSLKLRSGGKLPFGSSVFATASKGQVALHEGP